MRVKCGSLALLLLAALPAAAVAAPPTPAEAEEQARARFKRGTALYAEGAYEPAISEFAAAYELFPSPGFLFNIAQAFRMTGEKRTALEFYRLYIDLEPQSPAASEARAHVRIISRQLVVDLVSRRSSAPPGAGSSMIRLEDGAAPAGPPPRLYERWWLWTAIAVAATAVGVGVDLGVARARGTLQF